jgi:GNAT superfamily N-acetyltransferase
MRISEIYNELETKNNHAPYYVKHFVIDGVDVFKVFQQAHEIALARLSRDKKHIVDISVLPEHRKRNIAKSLYNYIEKFIGHKLEPNPHFQTDDGKAFWNHK